MWLIPLLPYPFFHWRACSGLLKPYFTNILIPFISLWVYKKVIHTLIGGCLWKNWQCVLGEAWIHSAVLLPWIMKIEDNCLSLQLLHFSIFGKKHKDRNNTSIRKCYSTHLGIHIFESREINLMARHELQDWLHWNLVDLTVCQLMHKSSPSIVILEIALQKAGVVEFNSVTNYWSISSDPWGICLPLKIIMYVTIREWKCKMGNLIPEIHTAGMPEHTLGWCWGLLPLQWNILTWLLSHSHFLMCIAGLLQHFHTHRV